MSGSKRDRLPAAKLPRRTQTYIMATLLYFGCLILYALRANLSFAMEGDAGMAGTYHWSNSQQGKVNSGFFWGYLISQVPGGFMATAFSPKRTLLLSVLLSSLFSATIPLVAEFGWGPTTAMRAVVGLFSGSLYPCIMAMMGRWSTIHDRSKLYSMADVGGPSGTILCGLLAPLIISAGSAVDGEPKNLAMGWPYCFNYPAILGLVWCIAWAYFVSDGPESHPRIGRAEKTWILQQFELERAKLAKDGVDPLAKPSWDSIPWKELLLSPPLHAMYIVNFGGNWLWYTLLIYLPKFIVERLGFDLSNAGFLFAVPYLCMIVGELLSSYSADWLISSRRLSVQSARTLYTCAGGLGASACLFVITLKISTAATIGMFSLCLFIFAFGASSGSFLVGNDLYPQYAGAVMGISNCIGTVPGIVSPLLASSLLESGGCPSQDDDEVDGDLSQGCIDAWAKIFYITVAVYGGSVVVFVFLVRLSHQGIGYSQKARRDREADPLMNPASNTRTPTADGGGGGFTSRADGMHSLPWDEEPPSVQVSKTAAPSPRSGPGVAR